MNCLRISQMNPRTPKLGWYICRVLRVGAGGLMLISLGLFEEGTVLIREMKKQNPDFMPKHLGPYGSLQMPSIFSKWYWYARLLS